MPKIKLPRSAPSLDMTPMVDLAFLLVTFFMLTAKFRTNEVVPINPPASHSDKILPENILQVSVDTGGRVFFSMDGPEVRKALLQEMGKKYNVTFTAEELKRFSVMNEFGIPIKQLPEYILGGEKQRDEIDKRSTGIPYDSLNNELGNWIFYGYRQKQIADQTKKIARDKQCRIVIKADGQTNYKVIKRVIKIFQDTPPGLNSFQLITNQEQEKIE